MNKQRSKAVRLRPGASADAKAMADKTARSEAGFTMIELLAVMAIIGILTALIIGGVRLARQKSSNSLAQSEIATMELALENFKSDNGIYPPTLPNQRSSGSGVAAGPREISNSGSLYTALAGGPKVYYPFKPTQIAVTGGITNVLDPYFHPYNYYNGGGLSQTNKATFDLWSYGKDGLNDTGDDITNWRR